MEITSKGKSKRNYDADEAEVDDYTEIKERKRVFLRKVYETHLKVRENQSTEIKALNIYLKDEKEALCNYIKSASDVKSILNTVCDWIENLVGANYVYILAYDRKRNVEVTYEHDEFHHLQDSSTEAFRYAFMSKNHESLLQEFDNDFISANDKFFFGEESINNSGHNIIDLKNMIIVDMSYDSSMNVNSLDDAVESFKSYLAQEKEYREILRIREEERFFQKHEEDLNQDCYENSKSQLVEAVVLANFSKTREKLFLCCGLNNNSDGQKHVIIEIASTIRNSLEQLEEKKLIETRDAKIEMDLLEKSDEIIELRDGFPDFEPFKATESIDKIKNFFQVLRGNETCKKAFEVFTRMHLVRFNSVFQMIFYAAGISNEDINVEFTNVLDWEKAKLFWNEKLLEKLENYNPYGPKPTPISRYCYVNNILKLSNRIKSEQDSLKEYSTILSILFQSVDCLFNIRKADITKRRLEKQTLINERIETIMMEEERRQRKEFELQQFKEDFISENENKLVNGNAVTDMTCIDESEFERCFEEHFPAYEIPEEVHYDEDNDCDFSEYEDYL